MTELVEEQAVTEEQETRAFEAGYGEVRGEEPPTEVEAEAPTEEVSQEPERNQYGFTDEETRNLFAAAGKVPELERRIAQGEQKIYGKLGEAFRTLKSLQEQKATAGFNVQISEEDMDEELMREYPDFAQGQLRSLRKVLSKALGVPSQEPAMAQVAAPQVQQFQEDEPAYFDNEEVEKRIAEVNQQAEVKVLTALVPDWRQLSASKDFPVWKSMQSPEVQAGLDDTWDSGFIAEALTAFKGWRESAETARTKRTNRLESAITPRGVAATSHSMDEAAAFADGFKSVRG